MLQLDAESSCHDDPGSTNFHFKPELFLDFPINSLYFKSERVFIVTIAIFFKCVHLSMWSSVMLLLFLTMADRLKMAYLSAITTLFLVGRVCFLSPLVRISAATTSAN